MKTLKIVCLIAVPLSFVMAAEFAPHGLTYNSAVVGVFGYTDLGAVYEIDTGPPSSGTLV